MAVWISADLDRELTDDEQSQLEGRISDEVDPLGRLDDFAVGPDDFELGWVSERRTRECFDEDRILELLPEGVSVHLQFDFDDGTYDERFVGPNAAALEIAQIDAKIADLSLRKKALLGAQ